MSLRARLLLAVGAVAADRPGGGRRRHLLVAAVVPLRPGRPVARRRARHARAGRARRPPSRQRSSRESPLRRSSSRCGVPTTRAGREAGRPDRRPPARPSCRHRIGGLSRARSSPTAARAGPPMRAPRAGRHGARTYFTRRLRRLPAARSSACARRSSTTLAAHRGRAARRHRGTLRRLVDDRTGGHRRGAAGGRRWSVGGSFGSACARLSTSEDTAVAIADGDLDRRVAAASRRHRGRSPGPRPQRDARPDPGCVRQRDATEAELRQSEQRLRRFVADASHELRTPVAAVARLRRAVRAGRQRPAR